MGGLCAVSVLRMFDVGADVLCHLSSKCYSKCLNAAADAKDGYLAIVGQPGDQQLGQIPLLVNAVQLGNGVFATPEWVDVATAAENERINMLERIDNDVLVGRWWYDDRHAPGFYHRVIVGTGED